jgi:hypothetical protein
MNPDLVYCRTPEGERLARSPRQIASYANRATLLLLDGQINVGELLRRFGETLPIEDSLDQLEREGLVHPRTAAGEAEAVLDVGEPDVLPAFDQDPLFDPEVEDISEERLVMTAPPDSVAEVQGDQRKEPTLVQAQAALTHMEDPPIAVVAGRALHPDEAEGDALEDALPPPRERLIASTMAAVGSKTKLLGLAVLGLALVAGFAVWLSGLRPQVEARASAALGVPVFVESLGFAIQHGPALALQHVTIGKEVPLALKRLEVMPDPRQGSVWSTYRLLVADASLKPSELSALARILGSSASITELRFSGLSLRLGDLQVGSLAGSLERDSNAQIVLKLADPAGGLTLEARPNAEGLTVNLAASPGTLPLLGRPQIGSVELRGVLDDTGLRQGELGMTGYGGKFDGTLSMGWAGPVSIESKLRLAAVSMNQVSRSLFERGGFGEGQASGSMALRARAARWEELTRIDNLVASFLVERGAIKGFDLGAALRERSPRPISGGDTRFESLRGRLEGDGREIRLWIDRLDSGALTASGQLTVDSVQSLRGNLFASVQVAGRGALHYPAQLAGTVARPSIQLKLPAAAMTVPVPGGAEPDSER